MRFILCQCRKTLSRMSLHTCKDDSDIFNVAFTRYCYPRSAKSFRAECESRALRCVEELIEKGITEDRFLKAVSVDSSQNTK